MQKSSVLTCQQNESLIAIVERIVKNAVSILLLDMICSSCKLVYGTLD